MKLALLLVFAFLFAHSNAVLAQKHVYGGDPWVEFPTVDYVKKIPTNAYRQYFKLTGSANFNLLRKTLETFEKAQPIRGQVQLSYTCDPSGTKCLYLAPPQSESPGNFFYVFVVSKEATSLFVYYNVEHVEPRPTDIDQMKILGRPDLLSEAVIMRLIRAWLR